MTTIPDLIVTRHAGAVAWVCQQLGTGVYAVDIPIMAEVTADDVRGKHVVGNLPLYLATLCASVTAIEFAGAPPRGQEYTAADMDAAGARLARYRVFEDRGGCGLVNV